MASCDRGKNCFLGKIKINELIRNENQNLSLKFVETATVSNLITKFIHI